ncbi:MAG: F0F1 ATP synthase subunit B family protein [Terriglobales bacterium]
MSFAQQQPSTSPPTQPASQQNSTSSDNAITEAQERLAHRENEAAGEEEENKQFKESPAVKWFAAHTGMSLEAAYWVLVCINFAIIAGLIAYAWKKNVPSMFRTRTASIRKSMDEARRASEDANRRLSEIENRLAKLDAEIAEMRKTAEAEAIAEEERIKAAAEEERRKVIETAEQEIEAAAKAARRDLKAYAASLAVSIAEKRIQVDPKTDQSLVRTFLRELSQNGRKDRR